MSCLSLGLADLYIRHRAVCLYGLLKERRRRLNKTDDLFSQIARYQIIVKRVYVEQSYYAIFQFNAHMVKRPFHGNRNSLLTLWSGLSFFEK